MKKYIYCLVCVAVFSILWGNARRAEAYSVKVVSDGVYGEIVPSHIVKSAAPMFKKYVKNAMKYYDKYKDADTYTYMTKIPDEYRDFIQVAREIQDSDDIVIRHPFYIYTDDAEDLSPEYFFVAERNREKLCIFSMRIDSGKTIFYYDKMKDRYSSLIQKITDETLFYQIGFVTYAETPEQISVVKDTSVDNMKYMGEPDDLSEERNFYRKKYEEKKDIILEYLKDTKKGQVADMPDEDAEPGQGDGHELGNTPDEKGQGVGVYMVIAVAVVILCMLVAGVAVMRRRRRE